MMKKAVCAAIIQNKSILLVEEDGIFKFPGGAREPGESELECLTREIEQEELPGIKLISPKMYGRFEGLSVKQRIPFQLTVYIAEINGTLNPPPEDELNAVAWIKDTTNYNLYDITRKIVDSLKKDGYM